MNDFYETTLEDIKLSRKTRVKSAGLSDIARCPEGEELKQQYDSALEEWRKQSQPPVRPLDVGGASARRTFQLSEKALSNRNAAANRMYLHRATCAICRRRR